ncbi:MAG: SUMF1/EgtB/PvdO family nonheme iron enzyme [Bacteroidales bacterium]|nr:SUMF1/EgtB/PvdO family nonheme iron enzyme [Bacteroidales bacterium]
MCGSNRVKRGGSWNNNANNSRVANRNNNTPTNSNNNIGFRIIITNNATVCLFLPKQAEFFRCLN